MTQKKIKCSICGTMFDQNYCPECGQSYKSCLQQNEPVTTEKNSDWWIQKQLVGSFSNTADQTSKGLNENRFPAKLTITALGEVRLTIFKEKGKEQYEGKTTDQIGCIVLSRCDNKGIGEGSAPQPSVGATIFSWNDNRIVLQIPMLPDPVRFSGYRFYMQPFEVEVEEKA